MQYCFPLDWVTKLPLFNHYDCYERISTPLFFIPIPLYPTPVTTQSILPVTPDLREEDIANTLEQLYANLTHFLTMHHRTPNSHLLSHQPKPHGAHPIGSLPHSCPTWFPNHHPHSHHEDTTPPPLNPSLDLCLPSIDNAP
jgi:hypothetical protein